MRRQLNSRPRILAALVLMGALPLLLAQGCPLQVSPSSTTGLSVAVSGPATDQGVSIGTVVSVIYTVQGASGLDVRAFYDTDGVPNSGDERYFATGLSLGTNLTALWNTAGLAAGTYHVGVYATDGLTSQTAYAPGIVTLQQTFGVVFAAPTTDVTTNPGGQITLRFNTTLSSSFSYVAFYDLDGRAATGDETTILAGSGSGTSFISVSWDTTSVTPGTYYVGVTVREVGGAGRSATVYATGRASIVAGAFVYVMEPSTYIGVVSPTPVEIIFTAGSGAGVSATVDLFYDTDQTFDGTEPIIATGLSLDRTSAEWQTDGVAAGTYYIGAVLRFTTMGEPIVAYAPGRVTLNGGGSGGGGGGGGGGGTTGSSFSISAPLADTTIYQGDTYTIRWVTAGTMPTGSTMSLYRDTDATVPHRPDGNPVLIKSGLDPAAKSYNWITTAIAGRFLIIGKLIAADGTVIGQQAVSSGRLTIRPPYYWVGDVGSKSMPGATLRGFNFQDHAGSNFTNVGDLDGDLIDDFVVIAQYAKPGLINPSGVGEGEAYLIFGNSMRLVGSYDLNRTGSKPAPISGTTTVTSTDGLDQGVLFTGVALMPGSTVTMGITSACTIPDCDGDGADEIAFGIPKADSQSLYTQDINVGYEGLLENDGHFLRGGVVIVSSLNRMIHGSDLFADPRAEVNRDGNRVIRLQEVGQATDIGLCRATCNSDIDCTNAPCFGQAFEDSDKDGKCDTYDYLAWSKGFFQAFDPAPYTVNPPLASVRSWCPVSGTAGVAQITGMYSGVEDLEPYGCRILGQAAEDGTVPDSRYGMTVSAIRTSSGPQFLLASSPNLTAKTVDIPDLPGGDRANSGVAYELILTNYWDASDTTPVYTARPHQYIVRTGGYYTGYVIPTGTAEDVISRPISIVGAEANTRIAMVQAVPDFNQDGLMDIVVGSPNESPDGTNSGEGAVYVIFRRAIEAEGNYFLEKLRLAPTDPTRLNGVLIRGEPNYHLGEVVTGGGDFNKDGYPDLIVGIPNYYDPADATKKILGAALIVFGGRDLVSPVNGFRVGDLVASGRAAIIVGANVGDLAGYNVTSAGDVDGDKKDDLMIAAPGASPRLPDGTIGLDYNGDGKPDDLTNSGVATDLTAAGVVYLVLGSNDLLGTINLSKIGTADLRGMAFVGRAANDNMGGGVSSLGLGARSRGLSPAGDVDGDGKADILIGSMLASPGSKTHAGETYLIYGGFKP